MKSFLRFHLGGSVTATTIWNRERQSYQAGAVEQTSLSRIVLDEVCGDDIEAAQDRADKLVMAAYPHDCCLERCGDWVGFGGSGSEKTL